jgi:hypothetical protein
MSFLKDVDYQLVVDGIVQIGNQLNKPAYRFMKGEAIALALEYATDGRLKYVDQEGYDSIDVETGTKYELKSTTDMFSKNLITGRVSISNTNKSTFAQTFDYLLCIQTRPSKFAIAQLTWNECDQNLNCSKLGQFNLNHKVPVNDWICKDCTIVKDLPLAPLDIRKMLEGVLQKRFGV